MLNTALYKRGLLSSLKLLGIFCAVFALYFPVVLSMFDPELGKALAELSESMPELMAMFGMGSTPADLLGFIGNYLYGMIMLVFPMVFTIMTANRLVAWHTDRGSMACLLAAPVKRRTVVLSQITVLLTGLLILVVFAAGLGWILAEVSYLGQLDAGGYALLNLGVLCLQLFIAGLCFLCSCIFNDTRNSLALGAGISTLAYLLQMLASAGKVLADLRYLTFFTLFNPEKIAAGERGAMTGPLILLGGAIILFTAAVIVFQKKDLPV